MNIDGVTHGIVLDHIKAGTAMKIYDLLGLKNLTCSIAILQNVKSKKYGQKDIIKLDQNIPLNLEALGYLDPNITINYIEDNQLISKKHLELPGELNNVIHCKNPRCITSVEQGIVHKFKLVNREKGIYRCIYCDSEYSE